MVLREERRLVSVAFSELSLQAIYAFRQGNPVPPSDGPELVSRARRRVLQSKLLVAGLLGFLSLGAGVLLRLTPAQRGVFVGYPLPTGLFDAAVLTAVLSLDVALLWWTGLQSLPTLLSSAVLQVLEPLPIAPATLRRVAAGVYLRLFDLPVVAVLAVTPLSVGWALGPWAGLAALPGAASAVALALTLALLTGRFFVRRVQGSGGGGGNTVVRWAYLVLWVVPAFGVLGFITLAPLVFHALSDLAFVPGAGAGWPILLVYPFPLATLPEIVAAGPGALGLGTAPVGSLIGASVAYGLLAFWAVAWLVGAVVRLGAAAPAAPVSAGAVAGRIAPQRPALAVLTKDLRIASRTPGYAFLILLPLLDSVALGLVSLVNRSSASTAPALAFGAVSSAALLATFFGPAFFALEVLAHSYTRTLPLAQRSVVLGKSLLVVGIYLTASALVLGITASRVAAGVLFPAFVAAELPAVAAASFLELGILYRWANARGQPITNLYAGGFRLLLVSLPGLFVAAAPLLLFERYGLPAMAVVAVVELAAAAPFGLGRRAA